MRPPFRPVLLLAGALALAVVLTYAATGLLGGSGSSGQLPQPSVAGRAAPNALDPATLRDSGVNLISTLQARLRITPKDHRSWSTLALAYVEQARITADPTYYVKADAAIARAAKLAPGDSVMLTAAATLAAARHEFTQALNHTDAALKVNPYSATAEAIRADALTELGRYAEARAAATRADDLDPGPSTFARLSYQAELRGNLQEATRLMRLSQEAAATSASSYAFAAYHLGELARAAGKPALAAHQYRNALDAQPTYMPALAGEARLAAARGDLVSAEKDYRRVVQRLPLIEYLVEFGELYEATGRQQLAEQQYAVATASAKLLAANGVTSDLETAVFEADHGSPAAALTAARTEWARRHSIHTADALAWALHASGKNREALSFTRQATKLGTRDARIIYHLGAIEAANNLPAAAATLRDARSLDAGVSPYREKQIALLLAALR